MYYHIANEVHHIWLVCRLSCSQAQATAYRDEQ